jgi:hypothetical protein
MLRVGATNNNNISGSNARNKQQQTTYDVKCNHFPSARVTYETSTFVLLARNVYLLVEGKSSQHFL